MLSFVLLAALVSVPPPPPPAPAFTEKARTVASFEEARVSYEFKRCGDARTNSNGRYVDAMGTPRSSPEWKTATVAMSNALTICQDLQQALHSEKDFLLRAVHGGTPQDANAARVRLDSVSSELDGLEKFLSTGALKYHDLLNLGWGNPHCVDRSMESIAPPNSLCPAAPEGKFQQR